MYLSIKNENTSGDKKSVAAEEIFKFFNYLALTCTVNLPFVVIKNIPITITQNGPFISTLKSNHTNQEVEFFQSNGVSRFLQPDFVFIRGQSVFRLQTFKKPVNVCVISVISLIRFHWICSLYVLLWTTVERNLMHK